MQGRVKIVWIRFAEAVALCRNCADVTAHPLPSYTHTLAFPPSENRVRRKQFIIGQAKKGGCRGAPRTDAKDFDPDQTRQRRYDALKVSRDAKRRTGLAMITARTPGAASAATQPPNPCHPRRRGRPRVQAVSPVDAASHGDCVRGAAFRRQGAASARQCPRIRPDSGCESDVIFRGTGLCGGQIRHRA